MLLLLASLMVQDSTVLTRVHLVVDSAVWADIRASEFLPLAFGSGPGNSTDLTFCERLACLVFSPPDELAGRHVGDVTLGIRAARGRGLPALSDDSRAGRVEIIAAEPPLVDHLLRPDSLPLIYYLSHGQLAVPAAVIPRITAQLRQVGVVVLIEGEGVVVEFPNVVLRLVPGWGNTGANRLTFVLRHPMPGNPTYQFASRSRLRFGPDRTAVWTF